MLAWRCGGRVTMSWSSSWTWLASLSVLILNTWEVSSRLDHYISHSDQIFRSFEEFQDNELQNKDWRHQTFKYFSFARNTAAYKTIYLFPLPKEIATWNSFLAQFVPWKVWHHVCIRFQIHGKLSTEMPPWASFVLSSTNLVSLWSFTILVSDGTCL
jgi:hypothetical protein